MMKSTMPASPTIPTWSQVDSDPGLQMHGIPNNWLFSCSPGFLISILVLYEPQCSTNDTGLYPGTRLLNSSAHLKPGVMADMAITVPSPNVSIVLSADTKPESSDSVLGFTALL